MMNKKIIAILIAVSTVVSVSAECWTDSRGYRRCDRGVVRGVAEGTVDTAGDVVEGTLGSGSWLNPGNWGERGHEKRQAAREERRERRYRD
jgi:hypothetical protein